MRAGLADGLEAGFHAWLAQALEWDCLRLGLSWWMGYGPSAGLEFTLCAECHAVLGVDWT
jgi:hypothetical protein